MKYFLSVESFISQFSRLAIAFKYYKVYWLNDPEIVCHKIKSLTMVVPHCFQDIGNELDRFNPHETSFILIKLISSLSS
jgi:hypothetical protein